MFDTGITALLAQKIICACPRIVSRTLVSVHQGITFLYKNLCKLLSNTIDSRTKGEGLFFRLSIKEQESAFEFFPLMSEYIKKLGRPMCTIKRNMWTWPRRCTHVSSTHSTFFPSNTVHKLMHVPAAGYSEITMDSRKREESNKCKTHESTSNENYQHDQL